MSKTLMATIPDATSIFIHAQCRLDHPTPLSKVMDASYYKKAVCLSLRQHSRWLHIYLLYHCVFPTATYAVQHLWEQRFFTFPQFLSSIGIQNPIPIHACLRDAGFPTHRPHLLGLPQLEFMFLFLMDTHSRIILPVPWHTVIIWGQCFVDSHSSLEDLWGPANT